MKILVLVGPTGIGKSAVALEIARLFPVEILSADSRQIFRFMDIGTAKPTLAERARVPHHFIDEKEPGAPFDAGTFGVLGRERIAEIVQRGALPLVVGGSGLYVRSLIDGLFDGPARDPACREELERTLRERGVEPLMEELRRADPAQAALMEPGKPRRVIRALEVFRLTGTPLSVLQREGRPTIPFQAEQFGLTCPRPALYRRIDERCVRMVEAGLIQEAEGLLRHHYPPEAQALHSVGYAEAFALLRGELTRERMLSLFQQNSRQFAKRQLTWFRRDQRIRWVDVEGLAPADVATNIMAQFHSPQS